MELFNLTLNLINPFGYGKHIGPRKKNNGEK